MKRTILFVLCLLTLGMNVNAQEAKNDSIIRNTKYGALETRKGEFIKYVDKKMKDITYSSMYTFGSTVRKFLSKEPPRFFLILGYVKSRAYIEYSDLVEVNKAFDKLFKEVDADCALKPDYLENKFITDDGFKIGYYIKKGKATWFVDFDATSQWAPIIEIKKAFDFANGLKDMQHEIELMQNEK